MPPPSSASSEATPLAAYSLPVFFAAAMGTVLLREIMAEPYGLTLAGASIDSGSKVITMLAPTVIKGLLYLAILCGVAVAIAASFTKSGAAFLKQLSVTMAGGSSGKGGRRLD